jgi:uncharacterized protein YjbI with pentapeptide repeats
MVIRRLGLIFLGSLALSACEGMDIAGMNTVEYCYSTKEQFPYQTSGNCKKGDLKISKEVYASHMGEVVSTTSDVQYRNNLKANKETLRRTKACFKCDLEGATLGGANLQGFDFREADLTNANFQEADLRGANLQGADLTNANFQEADLRGANLQGADLKGANLLGATLDSGGLAIARASGAIGLDPSNSGVASTTTLATQPKPTIAHVQAKDTTPPSIKIAASIIVKSDRPTVHGRVSDNDRVVQVIVEGRAADLQSDGTFTFTRYVPTSGTTVSIEAIDEWGNKSQKTVKLIRTISDTSEKITFANLDPTKINGRSNRDAVALIIGVADYTRAPAAVYADSDASVFGDYARRALGIPRSSIKVLTNAAASNTDIKVSLKQWLRGRIEEGKTDVYVFYAGHGLASSDGEDLYLLPYDGVPSLLEDTSLQRNELFDVIAAASPRSATIFLDTCYSGLSRGEETLLASARPILITPKHQAAPKGFTVFSAASGLQISSGLDEAKHGLFSYYLMKGLEGPADSNGDKAITAGELHAYVLGNVKRQAVRLGREQVPELDGDAERVLVRW